MKISLKNIIIKLGDGALLRRKTANGEGPVELFNTNRSIELIDWEVYHDFRNKGYGECKYYPSKYSSNDGLFANIPGHDEYYYFGLNEKGKEYFVELNKEKKNV